MPAPTSGTQTINVPPNKLVSLTAFAQSSGTQSVTVKNSSGGVLATLSGASSSGGVFTNLGTKTFQSGDGNLTVQLTPNAGILASEDAIVYGGTTYLQTYTFCTNDGGANAGDRDFNDLVVQISAYGYTG